MPRTFNEAITALQQAGQPLAKPEFTQVVAAPIAQPVSGITAGHDTELEGLLSGLADFNPKLQQFVAVKDEKDAEQAKFSGEQQGKLATIDPANVSAMPESMPDIVNPAFRPNFDLAYKQGIANRIGIQASAGVQAEYDKQKLNPEFNADAFLAEALPKAVGGISDPTIASGIAIHTIELSRSIRAEDNRIKHDELGKEAVGNFTASMTPVIEGAGNDPQALADGFNRLFDSQKDAILNYRTRPEISEMLVQGVIAHSISEKGSPALFDALDKIKDPATGKTIADTSPQLAIEIARGRKAAEAAQNQRVERDSQPLLFNEMAAVTKRIDAGERIPMEWFANNIGIGKQFASHEAALGAYKAMDAKLAANDDLATTVQLMKEGKGYIATPAQQKAAADYVTTPMVNQLMQLVDDPKKQEALNATAQSFAQLHATSNLTIPNEVLKRFIDGLSTIPADASGNPTPRFLSAAAMYRSFPPTVRKLYFGEGDANDLFKSYTAEVDNSATPATAYQQAYQGISADAKERMRELTKSPEWQTKLTKMTQGAVDSLHFTWKDVVPFASNMPVNAGMVDAGGTLEAKRFMSAHPNLGEADLKDHMDQWVKANFVHDTNTNMVVGVPPSAGQGADKVVSFYQKKLVDQYGAEQRPTLVYMGNGNYQVQTQNPIAVRGSLTWDQLKSTEVQEVHMTAEDRTQIATLTQAAAKGTLTVEDLKTYAPIMSKLRTLGFMGDMGPRMLASYNPFTNQSQQPVGLMTSALDKAMRTALENIPKIAIGGATNTLGAVPQSANDRGAQQEATLRFLNWGTSGMPPKLTEALITQGEGVVLKASPDPAAGAGNNIGMGYNLKANAATLTEDFRRAGVPVEAVGDIVAGRRAITQDQAERLLTITVPRYEEKAKKVIEDKYPGMWTKMTSTQKAVVTDVAYQVKDFSKFGPSIEALFSGDQSRIESAFQVQYKDAAGVTKVDTRRNNLRANLLKGVSNFGAVVRNN